MLEIINQFSTEMRASGFTPPNTIVADGQKHRFSTSNNQNDTAGEYCLYPNGIPAGYFGDWRTGEFHKWSFKAEREYSLEEIAEHKRKVALIRLSRENEHKSASIEAKQIISTSTALSDDHPYLISKGVQSYNLRLHKCNIVIPVCQSENINSIQFITPEGDKFFLTGGKITGGYYSIGNPVDIICLAEGYATGATIYEATGFAVAVTFNCWNIKHVAEQLRTKFPNIKMLFCADDDWLTDGNPGITKAREAAKIVNGIVIAPQFLTNRPTKATDFNDMASLYGIDSVKTLIDKFISQHISVKDRSEALPLPNALPRVPAFDPNMLPSAIGDYVMDVTSRQQCPPDFVAITALCAISGIIGNKVLIKPKQRDNWTVTPNLYGLLIGRPSAMKSPCMKEALRPIHEIEEKNMEQYDAETKRHMAIAELSELDKPNVKKNAQNILKSGDRESALLVLQKSQLEPAPTRKRIIVNDATVEKLGVLLNENPHGVILVRDEISGLLSRLAKEEFQNERTFYLECFDGNSKYTFDRIQRGTIEIKNCTLALIGGIQPSKISSLVRSALHGECNDGLIQRFQLTTWPDDNLNWKWIDRAPDEAVYSRYRSVINDLYRLNPGNGFDNCLNFSTDAQSFFIEWMEELQSKARKGDINPIFESHLLKMPKTIAGLALQFELVDGGRKSVGKESIVRALDFADYLIPHAERLYSIATNQSVFGAHLILKRRKKLPNQFTTRDIQRKGWSYLNTLNAILDAIQCLIDHNHISASTTTISDAGGRPTILYSWNCDSI